MFLRDAPRKTLSEVLDTIETTGTQTAVLSPEQVHVNVADRTIDLNGTEVALPTDGLASLTSYLDVPKAFFLRQDPDLQQVLVDSLLPRVKGSGQFVYSTDGGLVEILDSGVRVIPAASLLHAAGRVVDLTAPVDNFWVNSDDFRLDIFAPEGFEGGTGGDIQVGDLSAAGIRITQNRKHNLAPQVSPFQYRFFCTNGMSQFHEGLKVDARGQTVEEILAEFEAKADLAFRQARSDIDSFYDLRSQRVDNPERTLLRMTQDAGLAPRIQTRLLERIPALADEVEDAGREFVSTFDLINLITNAANDPAATRVGTRDSLQSAGASIVTDHAARCGHCQSRLNH